jgi:tetratricopeptide (TPR) repeat protein
VGDRAGLATTLTNIGLVYDHLGQREQALASYQQALPIREAVGDRAGLAVTLKNLGEVTLTWGSASRPWLPTSRRSPSRRRWATGRARVPPSVTWR